MKKIILTATAALALTTGKIMAQKVKNTEIPAAVRSALAKDYPDAAGVTWEKEKGNFEANWGGKSKEDNSVVYTPEGQFVEKVVAIPVSSLPKKIKDYVQQHYPGAKITEAGKVTDANRKIRYEAEVSRKDIVFSETGEFIKID